MLTIITAATQKRLSCTVRRQPLEQPIAASPAYHKFPVKYSPRFTFFPTKLPSFCFFLCQSSQSLSISSAVCFLLPSAFLASSFGYTTRGWSATISPI